MKASLEEGSWIIPWEEIVHMCHLYFFLETILPR